MQPKVSVAIITYNQRDFLQACVESVLAQDFEDYEIVVADDASTDGTAALLAEYEACLPGRFKSLVAEVNEGITANSNRALKACVGDYIAWMGGDDLMLPGKLRMQVEKMEAEPSCAICYHDLDVFDSVTGKTLGFFNAGPGSRLPRQGGPEQVIRYGTFLGACSVMTRRSACPAHGFDSRIPFASDWLFWIETAMGGTIRYLPHVLGRYRRHTGNVSERMAKNYEEAMLTLGLVDARYPAFAPYTRCYRARHWYMLAVEAVQRCEGQAARRLLWESCRHGWVSWKWLGWYIRSWRLACASRS